MGVSRFEDLIAWQIARELCQIITELTRKLEFSRDFKLVNQISDSSGSTMDNIAEGFERGGQKEFIQFLFISKASNAEVRSQLYRAMDKLYISKEEFEIAYKKSLALKKVITKLIISMNYNNYPDLKHYKL